MSKSVLVMETPEKGCVSCLIGQNHSNSLEACIYCPIAEKCVLDEKAETIPDWCPLMDLHIRYIVQNGDITITDRDGKILPWVPPKEWKQQINNALEDTITFSDESFFWEGEWTGGTVSDSDYRNGFYQYMNENKDNVFKITSVGGPYTLIPHFEILGK